MAPIRIRHPQGVSTIQIDLASATVQDLQQQVFSVSEIAPSQQERKFELFNTLILTKCILQYGQATLRAR